MTQRSFSSFYYNFLYKFFLFVSLLLKLPRLSIDVKKREGEFINLNFTTHN
jgi:hypothetical protein